jgi:hypothetical protein
MTSLHTYLRAFSGCLCSTDVDIAASVIISVYVQNTNLYCAYTVYRSNSADAQHANHMLCVCIFDCIMCLSLSRKASH